MDQLFNLEFQFESVFNLDIQPKFVCKRHGYIVYLLQSLPLEFPFPRSKLGANKVTGHQKNMYMKTCFPTTGLSLRLGLVRWDMDCFHYILINLIWQSINWTFPFLAALLPCLFHDVSTVGYIFSYHSCMITLWCTLKILCLHKCYALHLTVMVIFWYPILY